MQGLLVFTSLAEATRAGFQVWDRTCNGYLVRIRTANALRTPRGLRWPFTASAFPKR